MARTVRPLTATQVKNAKPREKEYKLADGQGLFLLVSPTGGRYWKLDYPYNGKRKKLSLGEYPALTLAQAREEAERCRGMLAEGKEPDGLRVKKKEAVIEQIMAINSFEDVAREWHKQMAGSLSESHSARQLRRLELYIFPWVGKRAINEVSAPELLQALRRIEEKGAIETAHRVRVICGQIFRYGIATGRADRDVAADLRGALKPVNGGHMAAITKPKDVGRLLQAIDGYEGFLVVRYALQLAPLVFVRPGELRQAKWEEIDFARKRWEIPAGRMKMKVEHVVPLSRQAIGILKELQPVSGVSEYLFPSVRSIARPISDNTLNAGLRRLGYTGQEMTAHGFRAMARTLLDEELNERVDLIEHQLAHTVKDPLGRAYNRTKFLEQRAEMMQRWADYLDQLKSAEKANDS